jgi:hypothetical protein
MEGDATAAVTGRPSARLSADDHCLQRIRLDSIVRDGAGGQQSLPVWRAIVMGACMLPRISLSLVKIHRVWLKLSARGGRIIPTRVQLRPNAVFLYPRQRYFIGGPPRRGQINGGLF